MIQTTFKAIWSNPKVRNSTLLVIVFDEHGGTYEHVSPPTTINPDGKTWTNDGVSLDPSFDFTRLGARVPAVLVSPYIPAGAIDLALQQPRTERGKIRATDGCRSRLAHQ